MPHFIGIGAQKAGTTWLYDMLAQNPSIWLPPLKEVHFFDRLHPTPEQIKYRAEHIAGLADRFERGKLEKGSGDDVEEKIRFLRSLVGDHTLSESWYRSIFDHPSAAGRVAGEITPSYLELSEAEMDRVRALLPTTKFVLIVREPQARATSQIKMAVSRSNRVVTTEKDWNHFLNRIQKNTRGNYQSAIPTWQAAVGAERLLILPFGQVRSDPAALLRQIETFIGAEPFDGYEAMTEQVHKTKEVVVPDWVSQKIADWCSPQKDYLIATFGQDFYDRTR
jgi:hypothetical protein